MAGGLACTASSSGRAGFKTPRAWAENAAIVKVLRGQQESEVAGVDFARAKSDATYFTDMLHQAQLPHLQNRHFVKSFSFAHAGAAMSSLTRISQNLAPEGVTINEHRAHIGLPPLPGCDVTNVEYALGIRR